jgi:hypothetical protein
VASSFATPAMRAIWPRGRRPRSPQPREKIISFWNSILEDCWSCSIFFISQHVLRSLKNQFFGSIFFKIKLEMLLYGFWHMLIYIAQNGPSYILMLAPPPVAMDTDQPYLCETSQNNATNETYTNYRHL